MWSINSGPCHDSAVIADVVNAARDSRLGWKPRSTDTLPSRQVTISVGGGLIVSGYCRRPRTGLQARRHELLARPSRRGGTRRTSCETHRREDTPRGGKDTGRTPRFLIGYNFALLRMLLAFPTYARRGCLAVNHHMMLRPEAPERLIYN